jgi:hypothetical protein
MQQTSNRTVGVNSQMNAVLLMLVLYDTVRYDE